MKLYRVDESARKQISDSVEGWGALPPLLVPRIMQSEAVFSFTPIEVADGAYVRAEESRRERTVGDDFAVESGDDVAALAAFLHGLLVIDPNRACLVEDVLALRGDRYLAEVRCPIAYLNERVFYMSDAGMSLDAVRRCILRSRFTFGHSLAVLGRFAAVLASARGELSIRDLEQVRSAAEWIIGAPDDGRTMLLAQVR